MPSSIKPHPHASAALHAERPLNPAQQAKAADPAGKGAAFGALVSQIARAKHDPPPPVVEVVPETTPAATEPGTGEILDVSA
jgi:hypothetical protein